MNQLGQLNQLYQELTLHLEIIISSLYFRKEKAQKPQLLQEYPANEEQG